MSDTIGTDLIQQGLTAARVGDIEDARRLLEQATQTMPDNIEAWLGLAGVVETLEEKQKCFAQVLAFDPDNSEAKAGLAMIEQKLAANSAWAQPAPPADELVGETSKHEELKRKLKLIKGIDVKLVSLQVEAQ